MTDHRYCVILAGGIGSRFWPLSREYKPKQFLRVWNQEKSFIRYTFERMARTIPVQNIYVATLGAYKEMVMEHLPELPEKNIVLEPYGRNTAPTIAYTAHLLRDIDPEAVMVAVPADHDISDNAMFDRNMVRALDYAASHDVLLTLGIVPSRPDTNFGYVQVSGGKDAWTPGDPVPAKTFTEKPEVSSCGKWASCWTKSASAAPKSTMCGKDGTRRSPKTGKPLWRRHIPTACASP